MDAPRTVSDLMTETLIVLRHDETLEELTADMDRFSLRHLPVVDGDRLVGLVTHRDVLRAALARGAQPSALLVRDLMSRELLTVDPAMTVRDAAALLAQRKTGCLLVTDAQERLLGIVTEFDFLRLARTLL